MMFSLSPKCATSAMQEAKVRNLGTSVAAKKQQQLFRVQKQTKNKANIFRWNVRRKG